MTTPNNTVAGLAEKWREEADEMDRRGEGTGGAAYMHAEANKIRARAAELEAAAPALSAGVVEAFDAAVAAELPRVSHVQYDSHEICKHFAGEVRKRLPQHPAAPSVSPFVGVTTGDAYETWCPGCGITISVPSPSMSPVYDRELIAEMLTYFDGMYDTKYRSGAILEQARLLREADNAEAASIRTVNRSPSVAGDAGELPDSIASYRREYHSIFFHARGAWADIPDRTTGSLYTADQMRAYGEQCRRLATAEQPEVNPSQCPRCKAWPVDAEACGYCGNRKPFVQEPQK